MSHLVYLLFLLTTFYTSAVSHTKCKEYLIIVKETFCPTNSSVTREPVKLNDLKFVYENSYEDSLETLSNFESFNKSYVVKFEYINLEPICVPIFKSTKLLEHIQFDENVTTHENKELIKTTTTENNETKSYPLECLIKEYNCDKKEEFEIPKHKMRKTVQINLSHSNIPTSNDTEIIYDSTGPSITFEKCVLNKYLCNNPNIIANNSHYNQTISQIILNSIGNNESSVYSIVNSNMENVNCANVINEHKNVNISHIEVLTKTIINKYYCEEDDYYYEDDEIENQTIPVYNVNVYLSIDLNILNTKQKSINCTRNSKPNNETELHIECNIEEIVKMHTKENYTIAGGNNSLPDISLSNSDFSHSLVYYCISKKVNTPGYVSDENSKIFNKYKVLDYQSCTKEFSTDDKKAHLVGSKILIFTDEAYKDNLTSLEFAGSYTNSLKLHFIETNISDCNERISLNIRNGSIFSLWPDEEKGLEHDNFNSMFIKLIITNCEAYNTKHLENGNNLELDIILFNSNNTRLHTNESLVNKLKNMFRTNTNRAILNCGYNYENTLLYNINSIMECTFLESSNDNRTTTDETPTSTRSNIGDEQGSTLNVNVTTETNTWSRIEAVQKNETNDNDPLQEMYYVSPRVLTTAIVAVLATIGSVLTYAFYLFRKRGQEYQPTPTRDWSEMDVTEF